VNLHYDIFYIDYFRLLVGTWQEELSNASSPVIQPHIRRIAFDHPPFGLSQPVMVIAKAEILRGRFTNLQGILMVMREGYILPPDNDTLLRPMTAEQRGIFLTGIII
jgi:hypothetical protein